MELGGTNNPAAFDAYLRGAKAEGSSWDAKHMPTAIAAYTEAIRLDPHYATAFAARSIAITNVAGQTETAAAGRELYGKAEAEAREAIALTSDRGQAHVALALVLDSTLNFPLANSEYERALELAPGDAQVLRRSGEFAVLMGRFDVGVAAARRAVVLDPLGRGSHLVLGRALYHARRYQEALTALAETISLDPDFKRTYAYRGFSFYALGDFENARTPCETKPEYWESLQCHAIVYDKHLESQRRAALSPPGALGGPCA